LGLSNAALQPKSLKEFLAWETAQEQRHEFADSRIVAMAGGADQHDEVRGAIYASLRAQLLDKPCRARLDVKLGCPNGRSRYPDVAVDCSPRAPEMTQLSAPMVVVEVLSPTTRATDYLEKPGDYGSVPSVQVHLIVDPDGLRIDVLHRTEDGLVLAEQAEGLDAVIDLPGIGAVLALAEVYEAASGPA
jgi:Uma2 family endonuclease